MALIGNMLGIDDAMVTKVTGVLKNAGLIEYKDGDITVLDRACIEKRSCECYGMVKRESDRPLAVSIE